MDSNILDQAPKIIAVSSKSPLGIVSLSILALTVIGFFFFRDSSETIRVLIFGLMFFGYGLLTFSLIRAGPPAGKRAVNRKRVSQAPLLAPMNRHQEGEGDLRIASSRSRKRISSVWFAASLFLLMLVTLQTLLGRHGNGSDALIAWIWLAPALIPPLSLVAAALVFCPKENTTISRRTHRIALAFSTSDLALLSATLLVEPFVRGPTTEVLEFSSLVASPFQGAVVIVLVSWVVSMCAQNSIALTPE